MLHSTVSVWLGGCKVARVCGAHAFALPANGGKAKRIFVLAVLVLLLQMTSAGRCARVSQRRLSALRVGDLETQLVSDRRMEVPYAQWAWVLLRENLFHFRVIDCGSG